MMMLGPVDVVMGQRWGRGSGRCVGCQNRSRGLSKAQMGSLGPGRVRREEEQICAKNGPLGCR